mmetsp:Transcript_19223/g.34730  ORF Transcript_19223/g.34730 Transcript_19223/m.34730 type:complete len:248 (-) Transcript_19223:58-801(-)
MATVARSEDCCCYWGRPTVILLQNQNGSSRVVGYWGWSVAPMLDSDDDDDDRVTAAAAGVASVENAVEVAVVVVVAAAWDIPRPPGKFDNCNPPSHPSAATNCSTMVAELEEAFRDCNEVGEEEEAGSVTDCRDVVDAALEEVVDEEIVDDEDKRRVDRSRMEVEFLDDSMLLEEEEPVDVVVVDAVVDADVGEEWEVALPPLLAITAGDYEAKVEGAFRNCNDLEDAAAAAGEVGNRAEDDNSKPT